jgi:hypothetical protein
MNFSYEKGHPVKFSYREECIIGGVYYMSGYGEIGAL